MSARFKNPVSICSAMWTQTELWRLEQQRSLERQAVLSEGLFVVDDLDLDLASSAPDSPALSLQNSPRAESALVFPDWETREWESLTSSDAENNPPGRTQ